MIEIDCVCVVGCDWFEVILVLIGDEVLVVDLVWCGFVEVYVVMLVVYCVWVWESVFVLFDVICV